MSRLWKIIIKLIATVIIIFAIFKGLGDKLPGIFANMSEGQGAISAALGTVLFIFVFFGVFYTMLSIFWFCFTNEHFVLLVNGFPIPFLLKIVAGFAGIFIWLFIWGFLEKHFGSAVWFDIFQLFIWMPLCLWIDIIALIVEKKAG